MAIKDLLIGYDGNEGAKNAARLAVQMAVKHSAAITGVHVFRTETYDSHIKRWIPADVLARVQESSMEAEKAVETGFREDLAAAGFTGGTNWISAQGRPSVVIPRLARYFDILLLGEIQNAFDSEVGTVQVEEILNRSGTPIIIVPAAYQVRPFTETAAVAWDGSRSAARALRDAMQILETKKHIDVLCAGKEASAACVAVSSKHDIIDHLKLHGIGATKVELITGAGGAARAILEHCEKTDPDVLIMGAYGRGKFSGALFGSLTRNIIRNMTVPVFMSH